MHGIFVGGVWNVALYLFLEMLINAGYIDIYNVFADFIAGWSWPGRINSAHLHEIFQGDRRDKHRAANRTVSYENKFFLNVKKGDYLMGLDPAFISSMTAKDTEWQQDDPRGMKLVYVLKYTIEEPQGIRFLESGAVFQQLLESAGHTCMLNILSGIMKPKLADFGAWVGAQGNARFPSTSPSAASSSAQISDSGLPRMHDVGGP